MIAHYHNIDVMQIDIDNVMKNEDEPVETTATYKQGNELINACYKMSIDEKRIFLLMLSKIDSKASYEKNRIFKLTVSDFEKAFPSDSGWIFRRLKDASDKLMNAKIHFLTETYEEKRNIMSSCRYIDSKDGNPYVRMVFNSDVMKYITELSKRFTKIKVSEVAKLTSVSTIRIYEMLVARIGSDSPYSNKFKFSIDDMKRSLCLDGKYVVTRNFIADVIKKSVNEINRELSFTVDHEVIRTGRKATHIEFTCLNQSKGISVKPKRARLKKLIHTKAGTKKALEIVQYNYDVMMQYKKELHAYDSKLKMTLSDLRKLKDYAEKLRMTGVVDAIEEEIKQRVK